MLLIVSVISSVVNFVGLLVITSKDRGFCAVGFSVFIRFGVVEAIYYCYGYYSYSAFANIGFGFVPSFRIRLSYNFL